MRKWIFGLGLVWLFCACSYHARYKNNLTGSKNTYKVELYYDTLSCTPEIKRGEIIRSAEIFSNNELIGEISRNKRLYFHSEKDTLNLHFAKTSQIQQNYYQILLDSTRMNTVSICEEGMGYAIYKSSGTLKTDLRYNYQIPKSPLSLASKICAGGVVLHTVINGVITTAAALGGLMSGAMGNGSMEKGLTAGLGIYIVTFPFFYTPCALGLGYSWVKRPKAIADEE